MSREVQAEHVLCPLYLAAERLVTLTKRFQKDGDRSQAKVGVNGGEKI